MRERNATVTVAVVALFTGATCNGAGSGKAERADDCGGTIALVERLGGQAFTDPTVLVQSPTNPARWYVGEQRGVIFTSLDVDGGVRQPFVDLRDRVSSQADEAGLLGMAFHPSFASNGQVFLSYTTPSATSPAGFRSRISRFVTADKGKTLDPSSEKILLEVDQPFVNHNGGHLAFGPDSMLYISFGDGGSANDPLKNAQNPDTLLGKILRIDVDGGDPFGVPADNPFAGDGGARPEIWALGMRNPWQFSFDKQTGALWAGDVGQDAFEEIDIIERGGNYGWSVREASHCAGAGACPRGSMIDPVAEYNRQMGVSVIGGFVYRGSAIPSLAGKYVFSDFATGNLWAIQGKPARGTLHDPEPLAKLAANPTTFAQDADGELYVADFTSGKIFQLVDSPAACPESDTESLPVPQDSPEKKALAFGELWDQVLSVRCEPCHTRRALGGLGIPSATSADALIGVAATTDECSGRTRVVPGDPDGSLLLSKLTGDNLCGPKMPLDGTISDEEIELVRQWIAAGAMP